MTLECFKISFHNHKSKFTSTNHYKVFIEDVIGKQLVINKVFTVYIFKTGLYAIPDGARYIDKLNYFGTI